jgi:hypothetical protein
VITAAWPFRACHSERSEESSQILPADSRWILRFAQDGTKPLNNLPPAMTQKSVFIRGHLWLTPFHP